MTTNAQPTFRPGLELLEDRLVPADTGNFFLGMRHILTLPALGRRPVPIVARTVHPAVRTFPPPPQFPTLVATPSRAGASGQQTGIVFTNSSDPGLSSPGLISPSISGNDPGLTTPGLPTTGESGMTTTSSSTQGGGLTLNPDGTITGSLFGPAPTSQSVVPAAAAGTAAAVPTIVNTAGQRTQTISLTPPQISILGFEQSPQVTVPLSVDPGLTTPGLLTPSYLASNAGLTTAGLPAYAPSQPVTQTPTQSGGLTLNPNGTFSGSFP
jgi:hypothetical protein